jgi:beta-glucanase (GH16 family)
MNMRLHTSSAGNPQVAAPEPKINGTTDLNQLYGRYEVRMRADAVDGYKTAWLTWPRSEVWPRDGEIDFLEGDLQGVIKAFMHRQGGTSGGDQDVFLSTARFTDWHTVALEWTPNRLQVFLDGQALKTQTGADRVTSRIPNTPMRCVLQTETELNSTYPAKSAVANVQLDYIKVWKYTG